MHIQNIVFENLYHNEFYIYWKNINHLKINKYNWIYKVEIKRKETEYKNMAGLTQKNIE